MYPEELLYMSVNHSTQKSKIISGAVKHTIST